MELNVVNPSSSDRTKDRALPPDSFPREKVPSQQRRHAFRDHLNVGVLAIPKQFGIRLEGEYFFLIHPLTGCIAR